MSKLETLDGKLHLVAEDGLKVCVDFVEGKAAYRRDHPGKELLKKALNLKSNPRPFVVDATAGLGRDALMLAHFGCDVLMLEQSTMLHELLLDGLKRAETGIPELASRLSLKQGESAELLKSLDRNPDIIYLDPMFPDRKKSAKVKKEMQVLRALNLDAGEDLLPAALEIANDRVIVKRPRLAPYLNDQKPDYQLEGRSVRFDVYLVKN